jgi:3-methyladenine DNA glycosylase AlkC
MAQGRTPSNDRKRQVDLGVLEAKNLAECLAVDFAALYGVVFGAGAKKHVKAISELQSLGIVKRMDATATHILKVHGVEALGAMQTHSSDTVRGWAAFMVGQIPQLTLKQRLERIKPYADDSHFGVREWAWMAVRAHIAEDLDASIKLLKPWTKSDSFRVRRFATEATRPRGVWAAHIQRLKDEPEIGLPLLMPLSSDPEKYVRDSVANWLNDAAKSQPKWVKSLCADWSKASKSKETAYIVKRALRSLKV